MKKLLSFFCLSWLALSAGYGQAISPYIAGQNAWMPKGYGGAVYSGQLDALWPIVQKSKVQMIRIGGNGVEFNMPSGPEYVELIDSIRRIGAEPMVQVSEGRGRYTAARAAGIVDYVNNVMGRRVKYWIIGNEPNLVGTHPTVNAAGVADYIKAWSSAMKQVDPSILIVGPECAFYDNNYYPALIGGANDITGKDANGHYYLDIVSFHTYPFSGTQTRAQVLTAAQTISGNVDRLLGLMTAANALHNRTGGNALRWALTEFNIDYKNPTRNTVDGVGAHSFLNGQFWAEVFGVGMQKEAVSIQPWSIHESSGARGEGDLGYLDGSGTTVKPRSAYYHEMLVAENMRGNYLVATDNQSAVTVLSSKFNDTTSVMILNKSDTDDYDLTAQLSAAPVPGAAPLKINVPAGISAAYSDKIYAQSTVVLLFDARGALLRKIVYSLQHAAATLPPTYLRPGQSVTLASFEADKTFTCLAPPEAVTYTASVLGPYDALTWDFGPGATPQTATGKGPVAVTYSTVGYKTVTLTLQNSDTTLVVARPNYVQASACARTPFNGTPAVVPGMIKAVEFDTGGQGVAYHDSDVANRGALLNPSVPRANESVDTEAGGEGLGNVGYSATGEWLKYTINVQRTGLYKVTVRVAASAAGGSLRLSVDDVARTGIIAVPATGGFGVYQDLVINNVYLEASPSATLKFELVTSSFNFSRLTFVEQEAAGIVVNRLYNATSTPDGMSDAVELLVTKDHVDIRGLIVKDFENNLTSDGGGKFQFNSNALWQDLRIGTTIVLRRLNSGIPGYAQDTDPADFRLDMLLENATYLTNLSVGAESFNLTNTDMVLLKTGSPGGVANAVHAFASNNGGGSALFAAVTGPKLVSAALTGTGAFQYPLNPAQSTADYNGTAAAVATDANRNWGNGYGAANIAYISSLRGSTFDVAGIVVNRIYNGSNDANGITDAVELLVVKDHFDARNLVVKDFESNNTTDNGGKYRFNNTAFWQDLRSGTTIVLRRLAGPTGYVQDTDAADFTLDLLLDNTTYLTNLATTNAFNITQYDMVLLKTGTAAGVAGAIHAFATKGGGANGVPSALFQSVQSPRLTSPDGTDAGGGSFHYPLNPDQRITDYAGAKGAISKSTALNWGFGFGPGNMACIESLRDSVYARPTAAWQGNATACAGTATTLVLRLTGEAPWKLELTPAGGLSAGTLLISAADVNAANEYALTVTPGATTTYRITRLTDAHRAAFVPTDSAVVTVQMAPGLTVLTPDTATAAYGQAGAGVAFAATATGAPAATLAYTIEQDGISTAIASPYVFPVGTTLVTATAATACGSATQTFPVTVLGTPASLSVLHQNADNQVANNTIKTNLQLRNETAAAIPYSELTVRYWLTAEDYAPIQAVTDWAQLGTGNVRLRYVPLPQPTEGAFGYVEYAFTAAAGSLPAGASSGPIQSRFNKQNWTNFNEANDFSYAANGTYLENARISVYRNGVLAGGVEPGAVPAVSAWKVYVQNTSSAPASNTISTQLQLRNEGNQPVAYEDIAVRYWFSPDGMAPLNYTVDYAQLGSGKVQLSTGQAGAETYAEMRFSAALGSLAPLSGTGSVQYRIAKADWSSFNHANDYSYQPTGPLAENARVTVYVQGQLVYGQEPEGARAATAARGQAGAAATTTASMPAAMLQSYPNPFSEKVSLDFVLHKAEAYTLTVYDLQGRLVAQLPGGQAGAGELQHVHWQAAQHPAGLYVVQLRTASGVQQMKVVKQ